MLLKFETSKVYSLYSQDYESWIWWDSNVSHAKIYSSKNKVLNFFLSPWVKAAISMISYCLYRNINCFLITNELWLEEKKKRKNKEKKSFTEEKRDSRNPITRKSTQKTWLETIFLNPCFSKGVSRLVWQHSHETWIHLVRQKKKKKSLSLCQ